MLRRLIDFYVREHNETIVLATLVIRPLISRGWAPTVIAGMSISLAPGCKAVGELAGPPGVSGGLQVVPAGTTNWLTLRKRAAFRILGSVSEAGGRAFESRLGHHLFSRGWVILLRPRDGFESPNHVEPVRREVALTSGTSGPATLSSDFRC